MFLKTTCVFLILSGWFANAWAQDTKGVSPISSAGTAATGTTWAVIVGISDYQNPDITDLQFAHRDAAAFAQYLQSPAGGNVANDHITLLLNDKATMAQFASALDWLLEKAREGDQTIIYFSGHGDVERKTITQPGFLLCWDAPARVYMGGGAFGLQYLQEIIATLSLQSKARVLVITDACRAGKLAGNEIGGAQATAANLAKQYANEIKIMSCQADEFSLEGKGWGGGRGVFSYYFLKGIEGLADRNNDGVVNLQEIERYLDDQVPTATAPHNQFPMTVGNKTSPIGRVDPAVLAALREEEDPTELSAAILASNDKGVLDALAATKDPDALALYNDFKKAVKNGQLLAPEPGSAWSLFEQLKDRPVMAPFQGLMRRNLAAALQDDAQQAINDYLKADPTELRRRWSFSNRYDQFPEYLNKAADLLGESHPLYKSLKARARYFAGLNYRLRGERTKTPALYKLALSEQQECIQLDPDAAYAYNELGLLYRRQGHYKESIAQFEKAIGESPGWVLPWANLCGSYNDLDDYTEALIAGKQAIRLDSNSVLAQYNLANAYHYLADDQSAILLFQRVVKLDPEYANAYFKLGYIYYSQNNFEQAEQMGLAYQRLAPNDLYGTVNLGEVSAKLGKREAALSYFKQALEADPNFYQAHNSLGTFYLDAGQFAEAESEFWRCIEIKPHDTDAYFFLACIHAQQNLPERALEDLEKALSYGYNNRKALFEDKRLANMIDRPEFKALLDRFPPEQKN